MAKYEHGVYEPGDEVRVFDASEDEEDIEGSRLPLLIVLALVVLAMFAGVVYLAYTQGVARGRGEMPVLAAASGPARVAPAQPGGTQVPYQGFKIYEQPAPPDDAVDTATGNMAAAKPAAQPVQQAPVQPAVKAAAQPAPQAPAKTQTMAPAPKPVAHPATKPAAAPVGVATAAPHSLTKPAVAKPAAATPAPAKPAPVQAAASGSYFLQVGAYKSLADAQTAWKTFQARHATLLAGHGLDVQRVDLGDKGVWYRARVAGFPSRDVADALCSRLKADGGNCFLAR